MGSNLSKALSGSQASSARTSRSSRGSASSSSSSSLPSSSGGGGGGSGRQAMEAAARETNCGRLLSALRILQQAVHDERRRLGEERCQKSRKFAALLEELSRAMLRMGDTAGALSTADECTQMHLAICGQGKKLSRDWKALRCMQHRAWVLSQIGAAGSQSARDDGLEQCRQCVQMWREWGGVHARSDQALSCRLQLAQQLFLAGDCNGAVSVGQDCLRIYKDRDRTKSVSACSSDRMRTMMMVAQFLSANGQHEQAIQLGAESIDAHNRFIKQGVVRSMLPGAYASMARIEAAAGSYSRAMAAARQCIRLHRGNRAGGDANVEVLLAQCLLAEVRDPGSKEDADAALHELLVCLDVLHNRLPGWKNDPSALRVLQAASTQLASLGKPTMAFRCDLESVEMQEQLMGSDFPATTASLRQLLKGTCVSVFERLADKGRFERALGFARAVCQLSERVLGLSSEEHMESLHRISRLLWEAHHFEGAAFEASALLALRQEHRGPEHFSTLRAMGWLARVQAARMGHEEEAMDLVRSLVPAQEPGAQCEDQLLGGAADPLLLLDCQQLQAQLQARRRGPPEGGQQEKEEEEGEEESQRLAGSASSELTSKLGPDHPDTVAARLVHASLCSAAGKASDAQAVAEQALNGAMRSMGTGHRLSLRALCHLALYETQSGNHPRAHDHAQSCRASWEVKKSKRCAGRVALAQAQEDPLPDPDVAQSAAVLALVLGRLGVSGEAELLFDEADKAQERMGDDLQLLTSRMWRSEILLRCGKVQEAKQLAGATHQKMLAEGSEFAHPHWVRMTMLLQKIHVVDQGVRFFSAKELQFEDTFRDGSVAFASRMGQENLAIKFWPGKSVQALINTVKASREWAKEDSWTVPFQGIARHPKRRTCLGLVMPQFPTTLRSCLSRTPGGQPFTALEKRVQWAWQAAMALSILHASGVEHGSLDCSQFLCQTAGGGADPASRLALAGFVCPEEMHAVGEATGAFSASDVYSFGKVLLEIFTCTRIHDEAAALQDLRSLEVPRGLQVLVEQCIGSDPSSRPSMPEVTTQLHSNMQEHSINDETRHRTYMDFLVDIRSRLQNL